MGMIINIDKALELRTDYNILKEPLHAMMRNQQEAWERENPIDLIFNRGSLGGFQETYTSSIGFNHAFTETSDYAVGPIFNTAEGFAATYRTRTFQGGFIITQQVLEDGQLGRVKDDASAFVKRWHGDIVEYSMKSLEGGFADSSSKAVIPTSWQGSNLRLESADTTDGDISTATKNALFSDNHKTVKREGGSAITQANVYKLSSSFDITSETAPAIVADVINQVITEMENYYDDNGKISGVLGEKSIVCANNPRLKAVIRTALESDMFKAGAGTLLNDAYGKAKYNATPYLNDIVSSFVSSSGGNSAVPMFFIVDKSYNASNHGLELTERVPFTLQAFEHREAPMGIKYEGRQRFDINVATWRGIAAVFLGNAVYKGTTAIAAKALTPIAIATPVTVVGTVSTDEVQ